MSDFEDIDATETTIEQGLTRRTLSLRFPAPLERRYEDDTRRSRTRHMVVGALIGLLVFNIFLVADLQLVPDVFVRSAVLRLGIGTPLILGTIAVVLREPPAVVRELAQAVMSLFAAVVILHLTVVSHAPFRGYQHYGVGLVLLYPIIVQRAQFPYLAGTVLLCFCMYAATVATLSDVPGPVRQSAILIMLGYAVFALIAAHNNEFRERISYLLRLRDTIRNARLDTAAKTDPLTGLANRRCLEERLALLWAEPRHGTSDVCAIMLDIDHFKLFNDSYGHPAGDRCIKSVAGCVAAHRRGPMDLAVRYGGEEIVLIADQLDWAEGLDLAERIRVAVSGLQIRHESGIGGIVTATLGVASVSRSESVSSQDLIDAADAALYAAKAAGRNQVWPRARPATADIEHEQPFIVYAA